MSTTKTLSNTIAGNELNAFLIHRCFPLVNFLNQWNIYASKFSLTKKATKLAKMIRGTLPKIDSNACWFWKKGAGSDLTTRYEKSTVATCAKSAIRIICCVSFLPKRSYTISVSKNVTAKINTATGVKSCVKPKSKVTAFDAVRLAKMTAVT